MDIRNVFISLGDKEIHRMYHRYKVVYGVPDLKDIIYIDDRLEPIELVDEVVSIKIQVPIRIKDIENYLETTNFTDTAKVTLKLK